jgi:hypothetical protein
MGGGHYYKNLKTDVDQIHFKRHFMSLHLRNYVYVKNNLTYLV